MEKVEDDDLMKSMSVTEKSELVEVQEEETTGLTKTNKLYM